MPTTAPPPAEAQDLDPPIIILGEDDDTFRKLIAGALRCDGYEVVEAKDGNRLSRLARLLLYSGHDPRPELIITDVRMPGLSGLDFLRALRQIDPHMPVILMTGYGSLETERLASKLGATTLFSKPFDIRALRRRVQDLLPLS